MRTMFVKLFFWFWLITILAGGISFVLAFNLRLSPLHVGRLHHFDEERRRFVGEALALYGTNAAALRERGLPVEPSEPSGPAGSGRETHLKAYLFAADGAPLSPAAPPDLRAAVADFVAGRHPGPHPVGHPDVVVTPVAGPSGTRYFAAAGGIFPFPPRQPLRGFPLPPNLWLNFTITLLISGLLCYILAWRLTVPIRHLRTATQSLARGDLAARVVVPGERRDELADLGRDFNRMAERIGKLVASHRQLLRDVSHELRSPLARLAVALGLARLAATPQAESALDRIEQESENLNLLIGELLELSRLEGESGAVDFAEVELSSLIEEVVRDADFEAQSAGRRVIVLTARPVQLLGSRKLLRRAIENVVRNGIRYTEAGSAVEVSLEESAGEAVVRVRDHGPGVPEGQLAAIFRPFFRVAEARDRKSGGTGIGLAICEGTVTLHGGSISARNSTGGGLEVEIRLPAPKN